MAVIIEKGSIKVWRRYRLMKKIHIQTGAVMQSDGNRTEKKVRRKMVFDKSIFYEKKIRLK